MGSDLTGLFEEMRVHHAKRRDRFLAWRDDGVRITNLPNGETLDDMIAHEQKAVENLEKAMDLLSKLD